jgi:hypothetical protein
MFLFFFLSFFFNIFHLIFSSPSDLADETARTATPKKAEKESVPGIFIFKRKEKHFKKKERERLKWIGRCGCCLILCVALDLFCFIVGYMARRMRQHYV